MKSLQFLTSILNDLWQQELFDFTQSSLSTIPAEKEGTEPIIEYIKTDNNLWYLQ